MEGDKNRADIQKVIRQVKVKVKCSLYRPGVAQRVGRGITLVFHGVDSAFNRNEY